MIDDWSEFQGVNAGYVVELYERFRQDPNAVDAETRAFFEKSPPAKFFPHALRDAAPVAAVEKIVAAVNLAESIRKFGNLAAHLDPLGSELPGDPSLIPENYGLGEEDLKRLPASIIKGPVTEGASSAWEVIRSLVR